MRKCVQILVLAMASAGLLAAETAAERAFQAAERAARSGDRFRAYVLYAEAAQLDPANSLYSERRSQLRNSPALVAETQLAADPGAAAAKPARESAPSDVSLRNDVEDALPPPKLKAAAGKRNFNLKGDARIVLEGA